MKTHMGFYNFNLCRIEHFLKKMVKKWLDAWCWMFNFFFNSLEFIQSGGDVGVLVSLYIIEFEKLLKFDSTNM